MNWLLPEHLADALPAEAAQIERLRRLLLDHFAVHAYEMVMPPFLEHLESLLTGAGQGLDLLTFKLVDQLSGRTLGVRADMTPQVARIDAHLLNRSGLTRLCYCDSVLHTLPACIGASREPVQIGAELYGHAGLAADLEIVRLAASSLQAIELPARRIDLGHVGIFSALAEAAGLPDTAEHALLALLQDKDGPGIAAASAHLPEPYASALRRLPSLYGGPDLLDRAAAELPALPGITTALEALRHLLEAAPDLPFSIDLSDLRGYHYYNGIVFAAYRPDYPAAIARGGRYDGVGKAFGRDRPATGFSMDLREAARLAPASPPKGAILAPWAGDDAELATRITQLRQAGEIVSEHLPGSPPEGVFCNRHLARVDGQWIIQAISNKDQAHG